MNDITGSIGAAYIQICRGGTYGAIKMPAEIFSTNRMLLWSKGIANSIACYYCPQPFANESKRIEFLFIL